MTDIPAFPSLTDRLFDDTDRGDIDPFALFELWFAKAKAAESNDPNAMAVATVDENGLPDIRTVLMNGRDARGFVFFTNLKSAKGLQLKEHPFAALMLHWKSVRRQVRARGPVEIVADSEADAYFATRPRVSQIGAHASEQSRPLSSKQELVRRVEVLEQKFPADAPVPRPSHWSGFRLVPIEIEFWKDGQFRLHDRVRFSRPDAKSPWTRQRLNP